MEAAVFALRVRDERIVLLSAKEVTQVIDLLNEALGDFVEGEDWSIAHAHGGKMELRYARGTLPDFKVLESKPKRKR